MSVDAVFWRTLRQDFESLQAYKFSLIWNSRVQRGLVGTTPGESHWSWSDFPDESLRARLSAMALRGALALGYGSEDAWYDQLREAEFVRFKAAGELTQKQADGTFLDSKFGPIRDVGKESITLCYKLEADAAAEAPTAGSEQRRIVPSWEEIRATFLQGADQYPNLHAQWDSREALWRFREAAGGEIVRFADPKAEELFKGTARMAVTRLGKSADEAPHWHIWLDFMRTKKRGFRRKRHRSWRHAKMILESEVPLDLPGILLEDGGVAHVFKESADFCADLKFSEPESEVTRATDLRSQDSPAGGTLLQRIEKERPSQLPELPPKFQNAFEAAKANAELEQLKLARSSPHPALSELSRLKLIQNVFFAYCAQARAACRAGNITVAQARQATDAGLPVISDLYFVRAHGTRSDDAKSAFQVHFTEGVTNEPQWHQHLSELADLAEGTSRPNLNGDDGQNPSTPKATDTPPKVPATPLHVAQPKRLQSTISSSIAARRVEAYLDSNPMKRTTFAVQAQTTDRTLRSFRKTGKVRRDIFENIAKAMGINPEALLKPE